MSNNNTVKVDLIDVSTKKVQTNFKNLKQEIKSLRETLETLDEGTAEYNSTLQQLSEKSFQYKEISEAVNLNINDLGQNLSNINKVTSGVVGSISLVSGALNILGVNSDTATEALVKTQSLLSIIAGLQALDDAEKNFQALWNKIKNVTQARKEEAQETIKETVTTEANTTAVEQNANAIETQGKALNNSTSKTKLLGNGLKNLWKSLKSFALSNPFTLIITGITTAISLISTFMSKAKQARIEARNALNDSLQLSVDNNANDTKQNTLSNSSSAQAYQKELDKLQNTQKEIEQNQEKISKSEIERQRKEIDYRLETIAIQEKSLAKEQQRLDTYTEEQKQVEPFLTEYQQYLKDRINLYKQQYRIEVENIKLLKSELSYYKEGSDNYNDILDKIEQANKRLKTIVQENILQSYQGIDSLDKQRQALLDKQNEDAKNNREKRLQEQYNKVREWLELEQKQLELSFAKREITEKDYYEKSIKLYEQYINKLNTKLKNNPNVSEVDRLNAQGSILDANKKLAEYELQLIKQRVILAEQTDILVIDEQKKLQHDIDNYTKQISENNTKILELNNKHWLEQYIILQQQNNLTEEEQINHLDRMLIEEENYLNEQEHVLNSNYNRDKNISEETYQRDLEVLKIQLDKLLITQEQYDYELSQLEIQHKNELLNIENEYNLQLIDIQAQRNQIELDYSNQRYEIARSEAERKIALNDTYFNSFQNIQSQLSSFLSEYQSQMDSNSEKYKELQRLQIIMDSASGSYSAFVSAFKSGVPFPYNAILGGLASSLVIGQGVLALNNLNNNKIGTTNAVNNLGNNSVYETLSYQQLGNIESVIRDSKVYVLESDISNVANRVNVVEMESRF